MAACSQPDAGQVGGDYLSPRDVAGRLGLAKTDTVLAWIHAGQLAAVNVGTGTARPTWRIAEADLADFLDRRRAVPTGKPAGPTRRRKRSAPPVRYFSAPA